MIYHSIGSERCIEIEKLFPPEPIQRRSDPTCSRARKLERDREGERERERDHNLSSKLGESESCDGVIR